MRNIGRFGVLVLLLALPLALFAQSQSSSQATMSSGSVTTQKMSDVIGKKVVFAGGQDAGNVRDVVIGDQGDFPYYVVEFNREALGATTTVDEGTTTSTTDTTQGGASGTTAQSGTEGATAQGGSSGAAAAARSNRYLIRSADASYDDANEAFTLSINAGDIPQLQPIDGDQLPTNLGVGTEAGAPAMGSVEGAADTEVAEGTDTEETEDMEETEETEEMAAADESAASAPAGSAMSSTQFVLGTQLRDFAFVDAQGNDLGKVNDAMMDLGTHRVSYLALASGGFLGIGEKLMAVSLNDISGWDIANKKLMVSLTNDQVRDAQGFDRNNWPATASEAGASSGSAQTK